MKLESQTAIVSGGGRGIGRNHVWLSQERGDIPIGSRTEKVYGNCLAGRN